jgi:hypothetical protein
MQTFVFIHIPGGSFIFNISLCDSRLLDFCHEFLIPRVEALSRLAVARAARNGLFEESAGDATFITRYSNLLFIVLSIGASYFVPTGRHRILTFVRKLPMAGREMSLCHKLTGSWRGQGANLASGLLARTYRNYAAYENPRCHSGRSEESLRLLNQANAEILRPPRRTQDDSMAAFLRDLL